MSGVDVAVVHVRIHDVVPKVGPGAGPGAERARSEVGTGGGVVPLKVGGAR